MKLNSTDGTRRDFGRQRRLRGVPFRCGVRSLEYFVILLAIVVAVVVAIVWFVLGLPFGEGSPSARPALVAWPPRKCHVRTFVCKFDKELPKVKMQHPEWSLQHCRQSLGTQLNLRPATWPTWRIIKC